jgi:hypothetical protein
MAKVKNKSRKMAQARKDFAETERRYGEYFRKRSSREYIFRNDWRPADVEAVEIVRPHQKAEDAA